MRGMRAAFPTQVLRQGVAQQRHAMGQVRRACRATFAPILRVRVEPATGAVTAQTVMT